MSACSEFGGDAGCPRTQIHASQSGCPIRERDLAGGRARLTNAGCHMRGKCDRLACLGIAWAARQRDVISALVIDNDETADAIEPGPTQRVVAGCAGAEEREVRRAVVVKVSGHHLPGIAIERI